MRFDDLAHVIRYHKGEYPKIHDDIFHMAKKHVDGRNVMDIGACRGLLGARMIHMGVTDNVLCVEPNRRYMDNRIIVQGVDFANIHVKRRTMPMLSKWIIEHDIKVVTARRVFPEIVEGEGIQTVKQFAKMMMVAGVETVILEGRIKTKNAVNPLYDANREVWALSPFFIEVEAYKNVRVLRSVKA